MKNELLHPPEDQALTLKAVQDHLRITHTGEDETLQRLIESVTSYFEQTYSLALIRQKWGLWLDHWPHQDKSPWWEGVSDGALRDVFDSNGGVKIPQRPLLEVSEVSILNSESDAEEWGRDYYRWSGGLEPRLILKEGLIWPAPKINTEGIYISYIVGFGDHSFDVPMLIRHGLLEMMTFLYSNRGGDLRNAEKASGAYSLWSPYRRVSL
ncbi:hypothetical protein QGN29_10880 [Temperatibacter marinus]|uniref:Phage gp6-like head-tail connector protein n=1 Tax=Temperatibacter marinus TaxID=1456591 RepID=A0AA52EHA4_9PROT|nr:hypothetical protein [Temperatibacter marinus]WND02051.1 hypothetical protein QGN29_10880 [Temperatibacter marinus]